MGPHNHLKSKSSLHGAATISGSPEADNQAQREQTVPASRQGAGENRA